MKQLLGKQQLVIKKLESFIVDNEKKIAAFDKQENTIHENAKLLWEYIDEQTSTFQTLIQKINGKLNGKPDFGFFDLFKEKVEKKFLYRLDDKIDKIEHKKMQQSLRNKVNKMEKEINSLHDMSMTQREPTYMSPFIQANNKCFGCHWDVIDLNQIS